MDIEKFKKLLADGNTETARLMLEDYLASSITSEERARALVALGSVGVQLENAYDEQYLQILKGTLAELKQSAKDFKQDQDAANLAITRKSLSE